MTFDQIFNDLFENSQTTPLLSTGWQSLDKLIGGGFSNELVVIGGRSLHGKSTFLLNLALQFSYFQQYKGMMVTPMSNLPSFVKHTAAILQDSEKDVEDWEEEILLDSISDVKSLLRNRLKLDFNSQNIEEIFTTATEWNASYLILDDFFHYMGFYYSPTAYQELLLKLHNFAQEAKIPVFISLLNLATAERRGGDRRPEIMDFYRSDILCQNAHKIFQLYRPIVYGITEDENGCSTENKLEINLLKNSLGKSGTLGFRINNSGKVEGRF